MARYCDYAAGITNADLLPWVFFALIALFLLVTVMAIHASTPDQLRFFSVGGFGFTLAYATICLSTCVLQFTHIRYRIR